MAANHNIFREAHRLLSSKNGPEMTQDELELVGTAIIPLMVLPEFSDITIAIGLDAIASLVEEANHGSRAGPRLRVPES